MQSERNRSSSASRSCHSVFCTRKVMTKQVSSFVSPQLLICSSPRISSSQCRKSDALNELIIGQWWQPSLGGRLYTATTTFFIGATFWPLLYIQQDMFNGKGGLRWSLCPGFVNDEGALISLISALDEFPEEWPIAFLHRPSMASQSTIPNKLSCQAQILGRIL